ncbi:MAG: hydantoinase/oxoprolinase family protein, partial [Planctomycetota bacterium]
VIKGTSATGSTTQSIVDSQRRSEPPDFWVGQKLQLLGSRGEVIGESTVASSDPQTGSLRLAAPLPTRPIETPYQLTGPFEAPVLAIRHLMGLTPAQTVPPVRLRLGTTRGTNALLTRNGAATALATTGGFGDILEIGYQDRPRLFDLAIRKPPPLYQTVIEIDERVAADGETLRPVDEAAVRRQMDRLRGQGVASLAICLLHADLYPRHEEIVERIAREAGFTEISRSSQVAPLVKLVARGDTTVVDAYLNPVLRGYIETLSSELPGSEIRLMTSSGGLVEPGDFRGCQSVLSGPAGGVIGYARLAEAAGFARTIGFDMGGTSTDVSRYEGSFTFEYETQKAGVRLVAPTLAINTVAAGGGSVCRFDGVKFVVGPQSAGAEPGPACYGRGGPLCVTDLNLYLGRIAADRFHFPLDLSAVERLLDGLVDEATAATGERLSRTEAAVGLLEIANANMAGAIRNVTVAQGCDPRDYVLVAFGGAAGQHACAVAAELGVDRILLHPDAGILSARGIGMADMSLHAAEGVYQVVSKTIPRAISLRLEQLAEPLIERLLASGVARDRIQTRRTLDMRYVGVDAPINVAFTHDGDSVERFEEAHLRQYGYLHQNRELEIVTLRIEVVGETAAAPPTSRPAPPIEAKPIDRQAVCFGSILHTTPHYRREDLEPGARVAGPALVSEPHGTTLIDPHWHGEVLSGGELVLKHAADDASPHRVAVADGVPRAAAVELFNNLIVGIAERMGQTLRRTAGSVNVKERLDFSCAVFSADGDLVANAPHVPVHLGAMGATVRAMLRDNPDLRAGDVLLSNDPYRGGSHLPDVTVAMPVHDESSGKRIFNLACRAHHAEIGGMRPGSMPPQSRRLGEEGVVLTNFRFIRDGVANESELRSLLLNAEYPSRSADENLADIRAQVA